MAAAAAAAATAATVTTAAATTAAAAAGATRCATCDVRLDSAPSRRQVQGARYGAGSKVD
jgi:hypothetical protein